MKHDVRRILTRLFYEGMGCGVEGLTEYEYFDKKERAIEKALEELNENTI